METFWVSLAEDDRATGSLPQLQRGSAVPMGVMGWVAPNNNATFSLFTSLPAQGTGRKKISCEFDARVNFPSRDLFFLEASS